MDKKESLNKVILITLLFTAGTVLSETFVNVFIWRLKNDYLLLITYLFSCYATIPFVFYLSGYLCMSIDRVWVYKIGIAFHAFFYFFILLYNQNVVSHLIEIGIIKGIAMGFYWFGYHILVFDYTGKDNRDSFYAKLAIISAGLSLVAPFIAGYLINKFTNYKGYYIIFTISSLLFLFAIYISTQLTSTPIKKPYKIEDLIFTKNKKWRNVMWVYFFLSAKDTIAMFLISILVYKATGSEFTLGKFIFLVSGISIITSYLIGKFSKPETRSNLVFSGSIIYFFTCMVLIFKINFQTLLIYGIAAAVADHLVRIPLSAYSLDIIGLDINANERKMEYIVARDIPIAFGRVLILILFVIFLQYINEAAVKTIIFVISIFPYLIYRILYK
jgi:YQGE family putative transporter